ncbi:MAG: response regulator [Tissierella sp.]|nr:response regulator [Tissierella sp.]
MSKTFIIVDDDMGIVSMLKNIIKQNNLGKVVANFTSGEHVIDEILFYDPDIVLIDYLLPSIDGVEIVNEIIKKGYKGKIVMISQVEDPTMVANAYSAGVLFFIKKPINAIEVVNIIKNVIQNIELEKSMSLIKEALGNVSKSEISNKPQENKEDIIETILSDIGIISDPGAKNLTELILRVLEAKRRDKNAPYKLQELYIDIANEESVNTNIRTNPSTIEQRVRRIIQKSLVNIAEFGIDDYYNPTFVEYSSLLFEFTQVKQEMNYIQGNSDRKGMVNIKKFIEGIITKLS